MGMGDLRDGLIMAKIDSLTSRTQKLTKRMEALSQQLLVSKGHEPLIIMIDEAYSEGYYANGFPRFQYQVYIPNTSFNFHVNLDFNLIDFHENEVFTKMKESLNQYLSNLNNDWVLPLQSAAMNRMNTTI